jgi:hypothetical protein
MGGWTRHQAVPRVAGPAFLFCACVASVWWARLSGAARFAGVELVTGVRLFARDPQTPHPDVHDRLPGDL